jgi:DNA-binding MarR family transcriptional regulator
MESTMTQEQLVGKFQQTMERLNTSPFVNDVAEYYQGESAMLSCIDSFEQRGIVPSPSLISERLHLARGTVTATLRSLERKKLAHTRTMRDDRRRVEVHLTVDGRQKAKEKQDRVDQWCFVLIQHLGQDKFASLVEMIDQAIAHTGYSNGGTP